VVNHLYTEIVGPYWPPERQHVENGYAAISFPFARIHSPEFEMKAEWNYEQLMGYLNSWSAVQRFKDANGGADPLDLVRQKLTVAWGDPATRKQVTWPLKVIAWRVNAT
jgi:hypothetical protein